MDRQTDSYGETRMPPQLRLREYTNLFQCGEIVEK